MSSNLSNGYIPGICNVGPAEIRSKVQLGIVAAAIAVAFIATTVFVQVPFPLRITVFFPIYFGVLCFVQAQYRFCVNYGLQGEMNFFEKAGMKGQKIEEAEYSVQDRSRAQLILLISLFTALLITAVVVII